MKKLIMILSVILLFALIGCEEKFISFNNENLSVELKNEDIEPKLPTKFPVKIDDYELQKPPNKTSIYEIVFTGEGGEVFNLRVHHGKANYHGDNKMEEVKVHRNDGYYSENERTGSDLTWTDGEYHYFLNYQTISLDTEVPKETMIKIAESFK